MTTSWIFDKHFQYNHDFRKKDLLEVGPSTSSSDSLNKTGALLFQIQQSSNPLDICNSLMYFKIKILGCDDAADKITLEHNWFLNLFTQISIKLGASEVESIENPGETSELINFCMKGPEFKDQHGEVSGWIPDTTDGDTAKNNGYVIRTELYKSKLFEGIYPLRTLFGFFQNYNRPLYLIPFELRMNKNENYKKCFYGSVLKEAAVAKIQFDELKLLVPSISCNPALETKLIERINTNNPINVAYLQRISTSIDVTEGTRWSWKPMVLNSRPRYIILGFKESAPDYKKNYSKFIQAVGDNYLKSIRIQLNTTYYPIDSMTFNLKENYQAKPFWAYVEMCKAFGAEPQLNMRDFKNIYPIFCFDVSEQDEKLSLNGVNITIDVIKDQGFVGTCFCVILMEKELSIELSSGKMVSINL